MKLVYVPLDERPCNVMFPRMQLPRRGGVILSTPPRDMLGYKKRPARTDLIAGWLESEIGTADALILPLEIVLYGGLIPSRIHTLSEEELERRLTWLHRLVRRATSNGCRVYLYGMIMRTPAYSSSEEEPDYYAVYGKPLFRRGYLSHKEEMVGLHPRERAELAEEVEKIPEDVITDYETRRRLNHSALQRILEFVAEGLLERLILPEDDTAPYGYGPREKLSLQRSIEKLQISDRVYSYPGADEVGTLLVAAAALAATGKRLAVAPVYMDQEASKLTPKYESQPLSESVRSQIRAMGAVPVEEPAAADFVLALNCCSEEMGEAWNQKPSDLCALRQVGFMDALHAIADEHQLMIAMADCASANGGTTALIEAIERKQLWDDFCGYAGWNTTGNTVGTALAQGALYRLFGDQETRRDNLVYRLLDDWAYQAVVRQELAQHPNGFDSIALGSKIQDAREIARGALNRLWTRTFSGEGLPTSPGLESVDFPWDRLFEIELHLSPTVTTKE